MSVGPDERFFVVLNKEDSRRKLGFQTRRAGRLDRDCLRGILTPSASTTSTLSGRTCSRSLLEEGPNA